MRDLGPNDMNPRDVEYSYVTARSSGAFLNALKIQEAQTETVNEYFYAQPVNEDIDEYAYASVDHDQMYEYSKPNHTKNTWV